MIQSNKPYRSPNLLLHAFQFAAPQNNTARSPLKKVRFAQLTNSHAKNIVHLTPSVPSTNNRESSQSRMVYAVYAIVAMWFWSPRDRWWLLWCVSNGLPHVPPAISSSMLPPTVAGARMRPKI